MCVCEGLKEVCPHVERGASLLPHRLRPLHEGPHRSLLLRASMGIFLVRLQDVEWRVRLQLPACVRKDESVFVVVFIYVDVYVFMYVYIYSSVWLCMSMCTW